MKGTVMLSSKARWAKTKWAVVGCAFAFAIAALVATSSVAAETRGYSVYLSRNSVGGIVINNDTGWYEPFRAIGPHVNNPEFEIKARGGTAEYLNKFGLLDCSTAEVLCVALQPDKMVFAFKKGRAGDEYTANGWRFRILAVGRQPYDPENSIYWISVISDQPLAVEDFVYTDRQGVVSVNMAYAQKLNARNLYLSTGPGLLSPKGYRKGRVTQDTRW